MTTNLGNTETLSTGIFKQSDGSYLAMTLTQSKYFKTRKGAEQWMKRKGYDTDGNRLR